MAHRSIATVNNVQSWNRPVAASYSWLFVLPAGISISTVTGLEVVMADQNTRDPSDLEQSLPGCWCLHETP